MTLAIRTDQELMGSFPNFKENWRRPSTGIAAQIETALNNITEDLHSEDDTRQLVDGDAFYGDIKVILWDFDVHGGTQGAIDLYTPAVDDVLYFYGYIVETAPLGGAGATLSFNMGTGSALIGGAGGIIFSDSSWDKTRVMRGMDPTSHGAISTSGAMRLTVGTADLTAGKIWLFCSEVGNSSGY